jgi:hypothetical protein
LGLARRQQHAEPNALVHDRIVLTAAHVGNSLQGMAHRPAGC